MFFQPVVSKKSYDYILPRCGACGLYTGCKSPKMPVSGEGRLGVLVVAEAPGSEEDERNEHLVGPPGQLLRAALRKIDVDLDRDCWKTNALICRPKDNRSPTADEIDYCRPNLMREIRELDPRLIIPLGGVAVRSLLAPYWRDDPGPVVKWAGWKIPLQATNSWVCPSYHPSHVLRSESDKEGPVVKLWFQRHLEAAFSVSGRPWEEAPDFGSQVRIELDPDEAARWLAKITDAGGPVAFDYETNRLKPDPLNARIYSCAVCWKGQETVAYPWVGSAVQATSRLLRSPCPKIGANTKFEDRWTRRILGHGVENWKWDTMISAHHLDCREGITSVKFQAFVRLGQEDWSKEVRPFLEDSGPDGLNRIHQAPLRKLLLYNGIDALVEYKLAGLQRKEMLG